MITVISPDEGFFLGSWANDWCNSLRFKMVIFEKVCSGLQWNGLMKWVSVANLKLFGQTSSCWRWCSWHIQVGRLLAISTVVVLSLLLWAFWEYSNKGRLRSNFFFEKRHKLGFCRPVSFCAAEVLGEGSGVGVGAHCHRPPYLCFYSKPPLFSRLLSPWCVSSLESDL